MVASPSSAPRQRWHVLVVVPPILAIVVGGYVATATWAELVHTHPAWLIALSPINRYLLLTSNQLSAQTYYLVGFIRHIIPDPFFWLLGYWYGDKALAWAVETYPVLRTLIGQDGKALEDPSSRKILYPLALFAPNNWVSLLCGAARLRFRTFALLNITGTLLRLVLLRWIAGYFEDEIRSIVDFVARYQWPATFVSMGVVVVSLAFQFRRGSGELVGITKLGERLEPDGDDAP